jgi:hypothetical protein
VKETEVALPSREVRRQQVHEQAVVPDAAGAALVLAHDPHRTEAGALVAADGGRVAGRREGSERISRSAATSSATPGWWHIGRRLERHGLDWKFTSR